MRIKINDNKISTNGFKIPAEGNISETLVLKSVSNLLEKNGDNYKSVGAKYICNDPATYSQLTIKVPGSEPIITDKELNELEDACFIRIPLEETVIIPYKIEFGKIYVSITCPSIELV